MKKSGYLTKKHAKGKVYLYLRRSYREKLKIQHEYIHSFGAMPKALEKMYWLRDNPESFPICLIKKGFDLTDLDNWILTVETNVTSTGREFKI